MTGASDQRINAIWRFPVKGLDGQILEHCDILANACLPGDREYAITTGHEKSNRKLAEGWMNKRHFIQLCNTKAVAGWQLLPDDTHNTLILLHKGTEIMRAPATAATPLMKALYREQPELFSGQPRLCRLSENAYTDTPAPWITIGGTASLNDFGTLTGTPPDNRRFRLNLILKTKTPFIEHTWAGRILKIGAVELEIIEPVGRCAAISVDPDTKRRDADLLAMMRLNYDHTNLGMFARISESGTIRCGDIYQLV